MKEQLKDLQDPRLCDMSVEDRAREWLRIMADAKPMPSSGRWKPKEKKQLYTRKPKTD